MFLWQFQGQLQVQIQWNPLYRHLVNMATSLLGQTFFINWFTTKPT